MKLTWDRTEKRKRGESTYAPMESRNEIKRAMNHVKTSLLNDYRDMAGEHGRLLRLALNEAEAIAWQTGYPQLVFPMLAAEKAKQAISWHAKQRTLRCASELSLAE